MVQSTRYPGTYIHELPGGVHSITAAATTVTAFIGRASRGPVNVATTIMADTDFARTFGGLALDSPMSFAVRDFYANCGGEAVVIRLFNGPTEGRARLNAGGLPLVAADPGSWGNGLRAVIDYDIARGTADSFNLTILDGVTGTIETFRDVSVIAGGPQAVDRVLADQSSLVRVDGALPPVRPAANPPAAGEQLWGDNPVATNYAVADFAKGSDGGVLTTADSFLPAGARAAKIGLFALEQVDGFNLLCIPPLALAQPPTAAIDIDSELISATTAYCTERRAMLIVDPPSGWTSAALAETGLGTEVGEPSANAALYFPRLLGPNPLRGNQAETFAPCGAVAGVIVRTDTNHGVWKAPAGPSATLFGFSGPGVSMTDAVSADLNAKGINCLRSLPNIGLVAWGARTRAGDGQGTPEWQYIPVRRTALMIEESLYRGLQWAVFEPNVESTWAAIRLASATFLQDLFRQGAFQGSSPNEAYFVRCDGTTTTPTAIAAGVINVEVGFAALKPAEFVEIALRLQMDSHY